MSRSTVDNDLARTTRPGNDVGFKTLASSDGGHEDFFAVPQIGSLHEIKGDCDAALVLDVGICDASAVKFGFENVSKHTSECRDASRGQGAACPVMIKNAAQEKKTFSAVPRSIHCLSESLRKASRSRIRAMESR